MSEATPEHVGDKILLTAQPRPKGAITDSWPLAVGEGRAAHIKARKSQSII